MNRHEATQRLIHAGFDVNEVARMMRAFSGTPTYGEKIVKRLFGAMPPGHMVGNGVTAFALIQAIDDAVKEAMGPTFNGIPIGPGVSMDEYDD